MGGLSERDRAEFARNGFVVLDGEIDADLCEGARELTWDAMPQDRDDPETWLDGKHSSSEDVNVVDELASTEPFEEILEAAHPYAEALVGEGKLAEPGDDPMEWSTHAEMAAPTLNYPHSEFEWGEENGPHIDGYAFDNGGDDVTYMPFTVGVTVYLDRVDPRGGGFLAWPGSHRSVSGYFEDHTYADLLETGPGVFSEEEREQLGLGPYHEVTGSTGTLTLWHHNLAHTAGPNLGGRVRMAAIGRLLRADLPEFAHEDLVSEGAGLGGTWSQFDAVGEEDVFETALR